MISIRNVTKSFGHVQAVRDVSLQIKAGEFFSLLGASGSGKTTLLRMLAGFEAVTSGSIVIDGQAMESVPPHNRPINMVFQNYAIFPHLNVRDNIAYARPDASDQEVLAAAERAQASDFIERLPGGFSTMVGERGLTLSGGQRQRLAIARALLADPRILILDDATSSVDASTEQQIKTALREVMTGRTTFVIAHRLSTIALAEEIVLLEDGRLVAHGDHAHLLVESDLYRQIVEKGLPDQVFLTRKPTESEVAGL